MSNSIKSVKKITATIFACIALTASFSAAVSATSGVITFSGSIVASPCHTQTMGSSIETKCWNDNGKEKTASIDARKLKGKDIQLPNHKGTQKFTWINKQNTLGIYTIIYD